MTTTIDSLPLFNQTEGHRARDGQTPKVLSTQCFFHVATLPLRQGIAWFSRAPSSQVVEAPQMPTKAMATKIMAGKMS